MSSKKTDISDSEITSGTRPGSSEARTKDVDRETRFFRVKYNHHNDFVPIGFIFFLNRISTRLTAVRRSSDVCYLADGYMPATKSEEGQQLPPLQHTDLLSID